MEERQPRKLAVILHADVVGSTALVQRHEALAHNRIQKAFRRLSEAIEVYGGIAHELRGDALVAEFDRASDAVCAALAFQAGNTEFNSTLDDDIQPQLRIGISMGEVVIADNTITGAGVVLAQRLEQLAEPGGVCIQSAAYETVPQRLPFDYKSLGEQELKGFEATVRAYAVALRRGGNVPAPELHPRTGMGKLGQQKPLWIAGAVIVLIVMISGGVAWLSSSVPTGDSTSTDEMEARLMTKPPSSGMERGVGARRVKAGRLNLQLNLPIRWDAHVAEDEKAIYADNEFGVEWGPQEVVATDKEGIAHFRVFKLLPNLHSIDREKIHEWMNGQGTKMLLNQYAGGAGYEETRGGSKKGNLGTGEELTLISSTLKINNERRNVRIAYVIRGKSREQLIVFFFYNKRGSHEISDDVVATIIGSATKIF